MVAPVPIDETGTWTHSEPNALEKGLARADFSVDLIRFTDARRPRSMELDAPEQTMYQYDPDRLLQGVSTQVPALVEKYLCYRPKKPRNYKVEIDLKRLIIKEKTGTFFSGAFGRYSVELEMDVIARRYDDSSVILRRTYHLHRERPREDFNGRGPSMERDRAMLYDMTESILRFISMRIGKDIEKDVPYWQPAAPEVIAPRLAPPMPVQTYSNVPLVAPAVPVEHFAEPEDAPQSEDAPGLLGPDYTPDYAPVDRAYDVTPQG